MVATSAQKQTANHIAGPHAAGNPMPQKQQQWAWYYRACIYYKCVLLDVSEQNYSAVWFGCLSTVQHAVHKELVFDPKPEKQNNVDWLFGICVQSWAQWKFVHIVVIKQVSVLTECQLDCK